jgi:hypothetical protein
MTRVPIQAAQAKLMLRLTMPLGRVCRMILDSTGFEVPSPEEEPSKEKTVVVDVD